MAEKDFEQFKLDIKERTYSLDYLYENNLWTTKAGRKLFDKLGPQAKEQLMVEPHFVRRHAAIDIGARRGEWSRWLGERFKQVYAFEARSNFCRDFLFNVKTKNVKLYNYAAGNEDKEVIIYNSIITDKVEQFEKEPNALKTRIVKIDDFGFNDVDFIKMDVEGFEYYVALGLMNTIKRDKPLICFEKNFQTEKWQDLDEDVVVDLLESIGMKYIDHQKWDYLYGWPGKHMEKDTDG